MYLPLQKVAVGMLFFSRNNYPKWIFPWKGLGENKIHPGNKKWHLMIVDIMHILTQNKDLHKSFVVNHRSSVHKKKIKKTYFK